ncbi:MAG: fibronectin type III domain-containing protein [Patescibacteria group bacterium]
MSRYKKLFHELTALFLIAAIIAGTFYYQPKEAYAATYTFSQSNWSGGVTANTASHASNQTGWTEYSSSTAGMSISTNLQLATTSFSFTDDGATSTSGVATGGGFLSGSTSTVVVTGTSTTASSIVSTKTSFNSINDLTTKAVDTNGNVGPYNSVYAVNSNTIFISYQGGSSDLLFAKSTDGGATWATSTVDSTGVTGLWTSIYAVDANTIFISYYDDTSDDLKFAKSTNGGASWTLATVDSSATIVGTLTSISAVDSSTIFIAYQDTTNVDVKFAKSTNGGTDWTTSIIDARATVGGGLFPSIEAINANTLFVSYVESGVALMFASSTNGGTSWATSTIDASMGAAPNKTSLEVIDANNILIAYDDGSLSSDVQLAKYNGTSWTISNIDTVPASRGEKSLFAADVNTLFVSYLESSNYDVKFATSTNGGTSWSTSFLNTGASYNDIHGIDANNVFVSYYANSAGTNDLMVSMNPYNTSGTFESATIDLVNRATFGAFSWNATTTAGTTLQFQVAANNTGSGWSYVGTDGTSGTYFTTSGTDIPSSLYNNRYFRYKAYLSSTVSSSTPILNDVTIVYPQTSSPPGSLISSAYDAGDNTTLVSKISWIETGTSTTETVKFQVRSSPDGSAWSNWCGPTACDNSDYFDSNDNGISFSVSSSTHALMNGANDRWFQYKVTLDSGGGSSATVDNVVVTYVVNAPPSFDSAYGTNGVSVSQISDSADSNWGKTLLIYSARDTDSLTGTTNPGYITPSLEYRLNSGAAWTSITSGYLNSGALSNKPVQELTYSSTSTTVTSTSTSAIWDAASQLGTSIFSTTTQIRVTANDNEAANSITSSTSAVFTLDTKVPTATVTFDSSAGGSTGNILSFNFSDDSNISYRFSNNSNLSADGSNGTSGQWQSVGATSINSSTTWAISAAPNSESVYYEVRDVYGNTSSGSVVAPAIGSQNSTGLNIKDVSNADTSQWREFISWVPYTATSGATYASYQVFRSTDNSNYSQISTITSSSTNYYTDSSVSSSTTYYYKVKFVDTDGDKSEFSAVANDYVDGQGGTDNTAPIISNASSTEVQSTWAKITWETDEYADSRVEYSATQGSYTSSVYVETLLASSTPHTVYITGLTPSATYYFRVKSTDILNNTRTDDNSGVGYSFTTVGGPAITSVSCTNIVGTSFTVSWNTNVDSNSRVDYSVNSTLTNATSSVSSGMVGSGALAGGLYQHSVNLTGLSQGTNYYLRVQSNDSNNNAAIENNSGNFYQCRTTLDTKPPVISNIITPLITNTHAVITWSTDEPSTSQVEYGPSSASTGNYATTTTRDNTLTTGHIVTISGLSAVTQYYFRVKSYDMNPDSATAVSDEQNFTSASEKETITVYVVSGGGGAGANDTSGPTIGNIEVSSIGAFSAIVNLTTNEDSTVFVDYGENAEYGLNSASSDFRTTHSIKLSNLRMGTDYHFKVKAIDKAGNSGSSPDQTFSTKFFAESVRDLVTLERASQFQEAIEKSIESILPSILPPFIEEPRVVDITENSAIVKWKTNIPAYSVVAYALEKDYDISKTNPYISEVSNIEIKSASHEITLSGLAPNAKYHYMTKSFSLPQAVGKSADLTFSTKAGKINSRVSDIDNDAIVVVWFTEQPASSIVEYKNLRTGEIGQKIREEKIVDHNIKIENLTPDTSYEIKVSGYSEAGSLIESQETLTAKTSRDVAAPVISNLKIDSAMIPGRNDRVQTIVSWKSDEPSTSLVEYAEGSGSADDPLNNRVEISDNFSETHNVIITKLKPGSLYRMRVASVDDAGNKTISPIRTIITPRQSESIVDVIVKNFEETFQFLKKVR